MSLFFQREAQYEISLLRKRSYEDFPSVVLLTEGGTLPPFRVLVSICNHRDHSNISLKKYCFLSFFTCYLFIILSYRIIEQLQVEGAPE